MFIFLKHKAARGVCINVVSLHQQAIYFWFSFPKIVPKEGTFHFSASLFPHLVYLKIYLWISVNITEKEYIVLPVQNVSSFRGHNASFRLSFPGKYGELLTYLLHGAESFLRS